MNIEKRIIDKLIEFNQKHIISYLLSLPENEQKSMLDEIDKLDFSVFNSSFTNVKRGVIKPITVTTLNEIETMKDKYFEIGIKAIQEGKVGAVLLAGGQGSRLGFNHPKGMFDIGVNRHLYIFECLINNMLDVVTKAGVWIPLFIMTSVENNEETIEFFRNNKFFGYKSDYIYFFSQEQLPALTFNGELMLADKGKILTAPNGNGGWYESMSKSNLIKTIKDYNIEWLNVFSVDNVLQQIADPYFIGAVIDSGKKSGAKVVSKEYPEEKVGVLCLENGKPSIIEYYDMNKEMMYKREKNGSLSYNYGVILNYLFRVENLNHTLSVKLPLHRAVKRISYMDTNGIIITPNEPNAYKYETLALDMVKLQDNCLAYEVERAKEFAPVKNATGLDSVDTARKLLMLNNIEL